MNNQQLHDSLYVYKAIVTKITDGDSFWANINRGFHDSSLKNIRLARIDAPEIVGERKEDGLLTKHFVEQVMPVGSTVMVKSLGVDSFGRAIAEVFLLEEETGYAINLNDLLVSQNLAQFKQYSGMKEF